jgi:hypothetical protein
MSRPVGATMLFTVALTAACAGTTSRVRPSDRLDPTAAYVYGRFQARPPANTASAGYSMGLELSCFDDPRPPNSTLRTYTIRFLDSREVQVLKIAPGRCSLADMLLIDKGGTITDRQSTPRHWTHFDDFAAGRTYYLGDYVGAVAIGAGRNKERGPGVPVWTWHLDPVGDQSAPTTAEMKRGFTALAALATEDRPLVLPRGAPGARRPEIPGDLMTPERVARLAGFIGRRYASAADCDAVCDLGACFAYRDEQGPAFTCVVPCGGYQSCPAGLACNCDELDDRFCPPIARTPTDPMTGICLDPEKTPPAWITDSPPFPWGPRGDVVRSDRRRGP